MSLPLVVLEAVGHPLEKWLLGLGWKCSRVFLGTKAYKLVASQYNAVASQSKLGLLATF